MIVFINGAFGVGKSSVSQSLLNILPHSLIFDPEEVGYMLRKIYAPIDNPDDFQDLPMWRELTVQTAHGLMRQYNRTLIIPMYIWKEEYFEEVTRWLRQIDSDFYHFCLIADAETIQKRLIERNENPQSIQWALKRLDNCLNSFSKNIFETKILTQNRSVEQIAGEIRNLLP